jgi:hypothetical protein
LEEQLNSSLVTDQDEGAEQLAAAAAAQWPWLSGWGTRRWPVRE